MTGNDKRYANDPLGGDKVGHAILRKLRHGERPRVIARRLNVSLERVNEVAKRCGLDKGGA